MDRSPLAAGLAAALVALAGFLGAGCDSGSTPADDSSAVTTPAAAPAATPATPRPATPAASTAEAAVPRPATPRVDPADLPEADMLIELMLGTVGGRRAMTSFDTVAMTSKMETIVVPEIIVEEFYGKPGQLLVRRTIPGTGESITGSDGKVGWVQVITGEVELLEGADYDAVRLDLAHFRTWARLQERFRGISTVDLADFKGRPCYHIRMYDGKGDEYYLYVDEQTKRLAGIEERKSTEVGVQTKIVTFLEWQTHGPLTLPSLTEIEMHGRKQHTITLEEVVYDEVSPEIFELPDTVRPLLEGGIGMP